MNVATEPNAGSRKKAVKRIKAFEVAFDQYHQLREKLPDTADIQEKNRIFRRLVNLLDVMEFLNENPGRPN